VEPALAILRVPLRTAPSIVAVALLAGCMTRIGAVRSPTVLTEYTLDAGADGPHVRIWFPNAERFEIIWMTGVLNPKLPTVHAGTWSVRGSKIRLHVTGRWRGFNDPATHVDKVPRSFAVSGSYLAVDGTVREITLTDIDELEADAGHRYSGRYVGR
jgi:hypothetical protein